MDMKDKYFPYEEYTLTFDHVMHTEDGETVRIGFPLQCKMCFTEDCDKEQKAINIRELFNRMSDEVIGEIDICI